MPTTVAPAAAPFSSALSARLKPGSTTFGPRISSPWRLSQLSRPIARGPSRRSAAAFICASPFSKSLPTSLSVDTTFVNSAANPLFVPFMRQVTSVASPPCGVSSKAIRLSAFHGFSKISRISTRWGTDERISMLPLPALRLPSQPYFAPVPD